MSCATVDEAVVRKEEAVGEGEVKEALNEEQSERSERMEQMREKSQEEQSATPEDDRTGLPSERDEAIYEAICIQSRAPAYVARRFGLATTTVRNIALQTQRKLARRQHELRQLGTKDSLLALFIKLEEQLHFVTEQIHHDSTIRSVRKTVEPEDQDGSANPKGRLVTTIRHDPNIPLRQVKLLNMLVKDMAGIDAQIARIKKEEEAAARAERARSPEGREESLRAEFEERTRRAEFQREQAVQQVAALQARAMAGLKQREAEQKQKAEEARRQAEQEYQQQLERKTAAMERAGHPLPAADSDEGWAEFRAEWAARDDNWMPLRDSVSDAAEGEAGPGDGAAEVGRPAEAAGAVAQAGREPSVAASA